MLPQGFLPAQDTARSLLAMELPPGSQLAYTEKVTERSRKLRSRPEVARRLFDGGLGERTMRRAARHHQLATDRSAKTAAPSSLIGAELADPDIRFWFLDENGLRDLRWSSPASTSTSSTSPRTRDQMKRIPLIANPISTSLDRPELRIEPKAHSPPGSASPPKACRRRFASPPSATSAPLAKFDAGDRLVPIRVQLEDAARGDPACWSIAGARRARRKGRRAAVGGRRHQARPGPDQHQPLRPGTPGDGRRRPRGHCGARRRHQEDLRPAGEESAARRQGRSPATPRASTNCPKALPPRSPPA